MVQQLALIVLSAILSLGNLSQGAPTPAAPATPPDLQSDAQAADAAQAAAAELFGFAVAGDFNALYDRIHPDAQAVVPRAAGIQILAEVYAIARPGEAEIIGAEIGSWTWPVTETTYPDAAQITFRQPFVDEDGEQQVLEDAMYLVQHQGAWRWFLGSDRAYLARVIGQFAPPATRPEAGDVDALLQAVTNDLDTFYRDVLDSTEFQYSTPGVTVVDDGQYAESACGLVQVGFWAFYCPLDQTIYLDRPFLRDLEQRYGTFAAEFVIGHEWAHHVQTGAGLQRSDAPNALGEVYSIELELGADCFTGVWALDADTRGLLELTDVASAIAFTFERLGDPNGVSPYSGQAHGSNTQRVQAFSDGYGDGFLGCAIVI